MCRACEAYTGNASIRAFHDTVSINIFIYRILRLPL